MCSFSASRDIVLGSETAAEDEGGVEARTSAARTRARARRRGGARDRRIARDASATVRSRANPRGDVVYPRSRGARCRPGRASQNPPPASTTRRNAESAHMMMGARVGARASVARVSLGVRAARRRREATLRRQLTEKRPTSSRENGRQGWSGSGARRSMPFVRTRRFDPPGRPHFGFRSSVKSAALDRGTSIKAKRVHPAFLGRSPPRTHVVSVVTWEAQNARGEGKKSLSTFVPRRRAGLAPVASHFPRSRTRAVFAGACKARRRSLPGRPRLGCRGTKRRRPRCRRRP